MKTNDQVCKLKYNLPTLVLILVLLLSGCNGEAPSLDSSAQAWVEYPYEGSILPMGQVVIVVYAADPGGINYIHIKINGESLPAYAATSMTVDGSTRLVRIDYPWMPPAEGEYRVEAAGVNSAGASGAFGSTRFCIVTCTPSATPTPAPGDTPTPGPGDTPTPGPTDTPIPFITLPPLTSSPTPTFTSPPPLPDVTVSFFADPPYVNAGNCATLHWDVTGTDKVYLNGTYVYAHGMEQKCLCETATYTLRVVSPDGTSQDYYSRIDVYGSCNVPTTPAPPVDNTGPTINSASTFWEGCSIYGQAGIYDSSGVAYAEFWYRLNDGGWISIPMSDYGGNWQSQYGVETGGFAGTLRYKIRAVDTYGNESWSGVSTYRFSYCGG